MNFCAKLLACKFKVFGHFINAKFLNLYVNTFAQKISCYLISKFQQLNNAKNVDEKKWC